MQRLGAIYLILLASVSPASALSVGGEGAVGPAETKDELQVQIRQFKAVRDSQLNEIVELSDEVVAAELEREEDEWRDARDRRCAALARGDAGDLEELELLELRCVLEMCEDRYLKLEERIAALEENSADP